MIMRGYDIVVVLTTLFVPTPTPIQTPGGSFVRGERVRVYLPDGPFGTIIGTKHCLLEVKMDDNSILTTSLNSLYKTKVLDSVRVDVRVSTCDNNNIDSMTPLFVMTSKLVDGQMDWTNVDTSVDVVGDLENPVRRAIGVCKSRCKRQVNDSIFRVKI